MPRSWGFFNCSSQLSQKVAIVSIKRDPGTEDLSPNNFEKNTLSSTNNNHVACCSSFNQNGMIDITLNQSGPENKGMSPKCFFESHNENQPHLGKVNIDHMQDNIACGSDCPTRTSWNGNPKIDRQDGPPEIIPNLQREHNSVGDRKSIAGSKSNCDQSVLTNQSIILIIKPFKQIMKVRCFKSCQ